MDKYYVNKSAQPDSGDHEVHKQGCNWMPEADNRIDLGYHGTCALAVKEAKDYYDDVNGCYYCSNDCHTT